MDTQEDDETAGRLNVSPGSRKSVGEAASWDGSPGWIYKEECELAVVLVGQVKPGEGQKTLGAHFKQMEARANGLCP